jgi:hypothetical protein
LQEVNEEYLESIIEAIGQLSIDLNERSRVMDVSHIIEPLLPHENDGDSFAQSDFLMARRLLILLWQTFQTASYIHVNGYGGLYQSHLFILRALTSMSLCNDPRNPYGSSGGNACPYHQQLHEDV